MPEKRKNNVKRRVLRPDVCPDVLHFVASKARYIGSQYHKRSPGNFNLPMPLKPLPQKSLCDDANAFNITEAQALLEDGVSRGLGYWPQDLEPFPHFSECPDFPGFPELVWSVRGDGQIFEAQLHNREQGHYHGYPIYEDDAVHDEVRAAVADE